MKETEVRIRFDRETIKALDQACMMLRQNRPTFIVRVTLRELAQMRLLPKEREQIILASMGSRSTS
jgi:uncharacterized protein (DUF1778 family)